MIKGRLKKGQRYRIIKGWDGEMDENSIYSCPGDIVTFQKYVGFDGRVICTFDHIVKHPCRSDDLLEEDKLDLEFYGYDSTWEGVQEFLLGLGDRGPGREGWIFKKNQLGPENVDYDLEQILDKEEDLL